MNSLYSGSIPNSFVAMGTNLHLSNNLITLVEVTVSQFLKTKLGDSQRQKQ